MALLMFYFAWLHPTVRKLRMEQKVSQSFSYFWSILKLGGPIGLTFFFEIAAFSVGLIMAGWISENSMAAHQIAINKLLHPSIYRWQIKRQSNRQTSSR
jgi:MATE family multidrug resistance protein